jgi:uncharacterized RDD family membrane protein YckC
MQLDRDPMQPSPSILRRASLLRRMASIAYEALLLVPVLFISSYLFLSLAQSANGQLKRPLFQLWVICVLAVYFIYCWMRGGQTLAMKTWRIRVAQVDGAPIGLRQAAARFFLSTWGSLLFGVGFWWALVDPDRQFLHDRLSGTRLFDDRLEVQSPSGECKVNEPTCAPTGESSAGPVRETRQ